MANQIRTCRYAACPHGKKIDLEKDKYKVTGKGYYWHIDCYEKKKRESKRTDAEKQDFQYIKNQWILHIDRAVSISHLYSVLNDYISRGLTSDYLVFTVDYVIKNKMKLHFPNGLQYYVERQEIRDAYSRNKLEKIDHSKFVVPQQEFEKEEVPTQKSSQPQKPAGFGSILRSGKKQET